jgi:hypothetical protein
VKKFFALLALLSCSAGLRADTVVLTPVADTMLSEYFPSNNFGGADFLNCGTSERNKRNRALMRFNLAAIPPGARIDSASLKIEVTRISNNGYNTAEFEMHRLLVPWGEGVQTNAPGGPLGQGSPAQTNEANWSDRFAFTTNAWSSPGGGATNDYFPAASAANTIYYPQDYTFTAAGLAADLQLWLDNSATNYGWIFVCVNEGDLYTARRFGSREDPVNTPLLTINYTPLRLQNASATNGQFRFNFPAAAGKTYTVQARGLVHTGAWQTLTQFAAPPAATNLFFTDSLTATQRFYRVATP